jgi:hypothetical protein
VYTCWPCTWQVFNQPAAGEQSVSVGATWQLCIPPVPLHQQPIQQAACSGSRGEHCRSLIAGRGVDTPNSSGSSSNSSGSMAVAWAHIGVAAQHCDVCSCRGFQGLWLQGAAVDPWVCVCGMLCTTVKAQGRQGVVTLVTLCTSHVSLDRRVEHMSYSYMLHSELSMQLMAWHLHCHALHAAAPGMLACRTTLGPVAGPRQHAGSAMLSMSTALPLQPWVLLATAHTPPQVTRTPQEMCLCSDFIQGLHLPA